MLTIRDDLKHEQLSLLKEEKREDRQSKSSTGKTYQSRVILAQP